MYALCLVAVLAVATAAPQFAFNFDDNGRLKAYRPQHHGELEDYFGDSVFDTRKFWQELESELDRFDTMLREFYKHFPTTSSIEIKNNEYIMTVALTEFEEQDIKVKAKEGLVMVQATRTTETGNHSYLDIKTLPSYVNVNGSWTFEEGILKIVFPLKSRPEDDTVPVTATEETEVVTVNNTEENSREEMETTNNENINEDADVGIGRGDKNKEHEITNNVIPYNTNSVEATTYAVDLKNEVEFVPIRY